MAVCLEYQAIYTARRERARSLKLQIAASALLLIALGMKVWIRIASTDLGYQVARERQRTVALDMERRELDLQQSVLLRADTLSRMAHERLGLEALRPSQARRVVY